jgi:hypothetical protein
MTVPKCPRHHVPMEIRPAEPRARCPNCGYATFHLQFEHCRECRHLMEIEEPWPHWHCPLCVPVEKAREVSEPRNSTSARSPEEKSR